MKIEFNNQADFEPTNEIDDVVFSILEEIELELKNEGVVSMGLEYEVSLALVEKAEIQK